LGHVWVDAVIGDPERKNTVRVRALVDTGTTLTVIPRGLAKKLGLKPTGKSVVETGAVGWSLRGRVY